MKQVILGVLVAAGILSIPALGLAATYQYVNVNGEISDVEANSAAEAMSKPIDIAARSGVMLVDDSTDLPESTEVQL